MAETSASKPTTQSSSAGSESSNGSIPAGTSFEPSGAIPSDATFEPAGAEGGVSKAKQSFGRALEEARAGAEALTQEAQERAGAYREKITGTSSEWIDQARNLTGQAKDRAAALAQDGKTRTSDALAAIGKLVADNATTLDQRLGAHYGDYARSAARTMQEAAAKLEAKDFADLNSDVKELIRKSPGVAVGVAAVAGFMLARVFSGSSDD
ncbi:MAG: hypothetical protein JF593_09340 [Novosphingobium sp.]|nr:hypothetical protein [Novosphingobium sp.]